MVQMVVVFDFDRMLIDDNSDRWVVTQMGLTSLFNKLRSTLPWNSLMDRMMRELHSLGCDLRIISDANQFFIAKILDHHGLVGCFLQIITNPSFVDDEGRLRISLTMIRAYLLMVAVYALQICARA